jgi:ferredoxin
MTARGKLWTDAALLGAMFATCVSGLVLLFAFHVELGSLRPEALGLSRLAWQNIHRVGAGMAFGFVVVHSVTHRKSIGTRMLRVLRGHAARQDAREVAFFALIAVVCLTGFSAWFCIPGSTPLSGPVRFGPIPGERHRWIDVHHLTALLSLYLTVTHIRRRWPALRTLARHAQSRPSEVRGCHHQTPFVTIETGACRACNHCARECPHGLLRMVGFGPHHHVRVDRAIECSGCLKCIRACPNGAITPIRGRESQQPFGAANGASSL